MNIVLIALGIIFLVCSLAGIACYYLYKRDVLHVGAKCVDKVLDKQESSLRCVRVGNTLYCNNEFYNVLNDLTVDTKYDLFTDMSNNLRLVIVPDDNFE